MSSVGASAGTTARSRGRAVSKRCLFTVVTPRFLPGALVMLASFLRVHPTFEGDIVVAHWRLPRRLRALMCAVLQRDIRFETASAELRRRIAAIESVRPPTRFPAAGFYFVEALRLREYERMLYCDSDLLFRRPVDDLFEADDELLAARDRPALAGMCRDAATFFRVDCANGAEARRQDTEQTPPAHLANTFNCGLLALNLKRMEATCYEALLAFMTPERYCGVRSADGFLMNSYFAGRQTLVSSSYNFLIGDASVIRNREGLQLEDAKVLHFNEQAKPWLTEEMLQWAVRRERGKSHKPHPGAFKLWYQAYTELLANAHLQDAAARIRMERP